MPTQTRISASAMSEIETAFKAYRSAVENSGLSYTTQATYEDRAYNFLRWLKYDFEPGSKKKKYSIVPDFSAPRAAARTLDTPGRSA
jgi:hypothetical protein